ncbi:MAG: hypothetical protein CSA75_04940, partial [Sorangium cellulosum]
MYRACCLQIVLCLYPAAGATGAAPNAPISSTHRAFLATPSLSLARHEAGARQDSEPTGTAEPKAPADREGKEGVDQKPETKQGGSSKTVAWLERENEDYRFMGLRARIIYIPTFMYDLFQADGGKSVLAPSMGAEYDMRRNGFETDVWLTYTSFSMDNAPFKSKSDPDVAYE